MPTCMSAVPRSDRLALLRRKLQCLLVGAHRLVETTLRNPDIRQGDCAADCVGDVPGPLQTRHAIGIRRCAASRSPLVQDASPRSAAAASAPEMVVLRDEVERPPGILHGPATSPSTRAWPARCTAIEPGRRRNSSSSTTTIPADERPVARASAVVRSSQRSASRRRASTPSSSPLASNTPAYTALSTGLQRSSSSGSALSQPSSVASCLLLRIAGTASSIRSAALAKSSAASAWRIASAARRSARTTRSPAGAASGTVGLLVQQVRAQHVGEEVVVAIPVAAVVERDDEEVAALQRLQHRFARRPGR